MTQRKVRVLFFHSSAELYGADRMLLRVIDALADDIEAKVIIPDDVVGDKPLLNELAARCIPFEVVPFPVLRRAYMRPRELGGLLTRWWRSWRILSSDDADVVWCATSAMLLIAPLARIRNRHVVLHLQEIWSGPERAILSFLALGANHILSISKSVAERLPKALARRARVVLNGTPDPGNALPPVRAGETVFLVASRWNSWKGHKTLLSAWESAGQPGVLRIAGGPPPSGQRVDVPALVEELGIAGSTQFVGELASIDELIRASHYVIVPSDSPEPFGLVAVEALALGRPVIASSAGGLKEIVDDGRTGHLFRPGDVPALSEILEACSADQAHEMFGSCRSTFDSRFSIQSFDFALRSFWAYVTADRRGS